MGASYVSAKQNPLILNEKTAKHAKIAKYLFLSSQQGSTCPSFIGSDSRACEMTLPTFLGVLGDLGGSSFQFEFNSRVAQGSGA